MISTAATLLALAALCSAQISIPGTCQSVNVVQNFNIRKYLGLWYEQKRYFAFYELDAKCVTATYTDNRNGTIGVNNYQVNSKTGANSSILGYAAPESNSGEAKLLVTFPSVGQRPGQYWVLGTDYRSYSVVWSCTQVSPASTLQNAWLLTRKKFPSTSVLATAQRVIDRNMLAPQFLITDHTDCPRCQVNI